MNGDLQIVAGPQNILAQVTAIISLFYGPVQPVCPKDILSPDVNEGMFYLTGIRGDNNPFEQAVRVVFDQHPVFESSRFTFIRITHQIARENPRRQEAPFDTGRESGSASPAQTRLFDHVNQVLGSKLFERFFQSLITPSLKVYIYLVRVGHSHIPQEHFLFHTTAIPSESRRSSLRSDSRNTCH